MRKVSFVLFGIILLFSVLTGCGSNANTGSGSGNGQASGSQGQTTLNLYTWYPDSQANWKDVIAAYQKKNPNVKINVIDQSEKGDAREALQKLDLSAASGEQMDILMFSNVSSYAQRVESGLLAPLDEYLKKAGINYDEEYKVDMKINGKYYALPGKIINYFVMLNKDMLDKAGLPVPKEWTWDDFMAYAKKLTSGEGPAKVYGTYFHTWADPYMSLMLANNPNNNHILTDDGKPNIDNDRVRKSLQMLIQMENVDKTATPYVDIVSQKMNYRNVYFGKQAAMIVTGDWMIPEAAGTATVPATFTSVFAPYPKYSKGDPNGSTEGGSDVIGVANSSKHKQEAFDFLRWYTTEGILASGKMVSAWKKADLNQMIDNLVKNGIDPSKVDKQSLVDVEKITNPVKITLPKSYMNDAQNLYVAEVEKYLLGKQDLDSTIQNATKKVQGLADQNK